MPDDDRTAEPMTDAELELVAARLGGDPRTLLSTYAHLLSRSDAQAAEAVAAVLVDSPLTDQAVSPPLRGPAYLMLL
jgi:hypothetical protein